MPPLNFGEAAVDEDDDVTCVGSGFGAPILVHNVDPKKVERRTYVPLNEFLENPTVIYLDCLPRGWLADLSFFQKLVPDHYRNGNDPGPADKIGWLTYDHMNSWVEIIIRMRPANAVWTVSKSWTASTYPTKKGYVPMLTIAPWIRGTLDGSTPPYPSWDDVVFMLMPMNVGGNHWVTLIINLSLSSLFVLDSLHSTDRCGYLKNYLEKWTGHLNTCLEESGHFARTGRRHYNFTFFYNDPVFPCPQQKNSSDCGVITCWLLYQFVTSNFPARWDEKNMELFF